MSARAPVGQDADAALMRRVQADDPDAFAMLYDRFAARAYGVAFSVGRDDARAEDVVQDAFLSVWTARQRYRPERGTVVAWILGTVRNRAIDSLRRNRRHDDRRAGLDMIEERVPAPGNVEEEAGERDQAAQLRSTLARLPAAQRDVITLAYFGELSTIEIAEELALPLGTVKGRMRLGLHKLRADELPEPDDR